MMRRLSYVAIPLLAAIGVMAFLFNQVLGLGEESDRPPLPDAALTPPVPPGATPGPLTEASPAPPLPAPNPQSCPSVVDLRGLPGSLPTIAEFDAYVSTQRDLLHSEADKDPSGAEVAGVNLIRHLNQPELDAILEKYSLDWLNTYWEASNGVHGAMSQSVGPQTLAALEAELRTRGDLAPGDNITGAYYFTVTETPLATLAQLDKETDILLVDVGPLAERDAAIASGACVRFAVPDPLWYDYMTLAGEASQ